MRKLFAKMRNEEGKGLVEYALILVLISILSMIMLTNVGTGMNSAFSTIAGTV